MHPPCSLFFSPDNKRGEGLYKIERQQKMLEYIRKKKQVSVAELSEVFGVSKVTIRIDVDELDKRGLIEKAHGGVISKEIGSFTEIPYEIKCAEHIAEKTAIAKIASHFVNPNDVIILDSGSTVFQMLQFLPSNITVLTVDILIAAEIAKMKRNIRVFLPSGELDCEVYTIEGIDTVRFFESLRVDKAFIGCDGLDFNYGITDRSREYAAVKRTMIEAAADVTMLADSSKFTSKNGSKVCDLSMINTLITDAISEEQMQCCRDNNVNLIIAKP